MSDTDTNINTIISTNGPNSICYVCLGTDGPFVRPCNNQRCSARLHPHCIKEQIETNSKLNKCGVCKNNIVTNKGKNINIKKCFEKYLKGIYLFVMMTFGSSSLFIMALGNTTTAPWIHCGTFGQVHPCDDGAIGTLFFVLPFLALFWQFRCCCKYNIIKCESLKDKIRYKSYITMFLMLLLANSLIFFAHVIGHPIIKYMFGRDVFFTWRTSLAGFIVYAIVLTVIGIGFCVYGVGTCIKVDMEERFGEMDYGIAINDEVVDLL